jgi:16S rRNA (guanine527-N7)-methyltransferase
MPLGLVSPNDLDRLWDRHVLDSLRVLRCLEPDDRDIADLGSGAGLPGIPVAIARPETRVALIEPQRRRAAFLELAIEQLGLANVSLHMARAQDVQIVADVVMARALGGQKEVWALGAPLLNDRGRVLYFAGRNWKPDPSERADPATSEGPAIVGTCVTPELDWEGPIVMMRSAGPSAEDGG